MKPTSLLQYLCQTYLYTTPKYEGNLLAFNDCLVLNQAVVLRFNYFITHKFLYLF